MLLGTLHYLTEGGDDIGWLGKVEGNRGRLELVKGKEIGGETTYIIIGRVRDAVGNETGISITFTTAALPFHIVVPEGLTAVWLFDERKGNVVEDSSGNWLDGRIDGDARWVGGVFGHALQFTGQGQGVVIENHRAFNFEEGITLTAWFHTDYAVTNRPLITKKDSFYVGFNHAGFLEFVIQPDDTTFFAEFPFNNELKKWHHFAVTFDGNGTTFYINGDRNTWWGRQNNVPIAPSETDLVIGAGFAGIIDEVALYNKALTENEIVEIMHGFVR